MRLKSLLVHGLLACLAAGPLRGSAAPSTDALEKAATIAYYPSLRRLEVRIAGLTVADDLTKAVASVRRLENDTVVARSKLPFKDHQAMLDLPALADGVYEVRLSLGENQPEVARRFKHKNYPWLGNSLGIGHTVYPPFTPITVDGSGQVQPACPIWEQREYYKRIWLLMMELVQQGIPPFPLAYTQHITNTRVLPLNSWSDASLDLEWEWYHLDTVRTADGASITPFPHQLLLAETAGRQTGSLPHALAGVTGVGRESTSLSAELARCEWGMRTVHEILPLQPFSSFESFRKLEKLKQDFGYGSTECAVFNYWADNSPVEVTDPDAKWLLLSRPDQKTLLLVLQSWHKTETKPTVVIDMNRLGFTLAANCRDAESGAELPVSSGPKPRLEVLLPGPYGTRVLTLGLIK